MSAQNDGGPAFPTGEKLDPQDGRVQQYMVPGMSLRDYFAAKAMQAIFDGSRLPASASDVAKQAYQIADAMLRAREAQS